LGLEPERATCGWLFCFAVLNWLACNVVLSGATIAADLHYSKIFSLFCIPRLQPACLRAHFVGHPHQWHGCDRPGGGAHPALGAARGAAYKGAEPNDGRDGMRSAKITRRTAETDIGVEIGLDGTGRYDIATGVGFFDHMLDQLARHSLIDMQIRGAGDTHIDDHHTVEDTGIALGQALAEALGDKRGIRRYGACLLPMDDALVRAALDLSGRPYLVWNVDFPTSKIGGFDCELVREFFQAFSTHGGITLHVDALHGINSHHIAEAAFKAVARALRDAVETDPRKSDAVPSTKGAL